MPVLEWAAGHVCTEDGRRLFASTTPTFLGTQYLGLTFYDHQATWCELFEEHQRLLLLSPRTHGKTEIVARVYALSKIVGDRNIRILVVSNTAENAEKRVDQVAGDLENEGLVADFGTFRPTKKAGERGKWRASMIYVSGRTQSSRDATMEGVGASGSITGGHFDIIILDDPVDPDDAQSPTQRQRMHDWFYGTIMELCEPHTRVIIIGTRKHADDLYGRIIKDDPTFHVHTDIAIMKWPSKFEFVTHMVEGREVLDRIEHTGDGEVLCPDRWSMEDLLLKYKANSVTFMRENQNTLVDDETTIFKRVYFTGGTSRSVPGREFPGCYDEERVLVPPKGEYRNPERLVILQAWDLSLVEDKKHAQMHDTDFTCGVTAGWDPATDNRYLLGFAYERGLLPSQLRSMVKLEAARFFAGEPWGVRHIALERNAFGRVHHLELQRSTDLPLVPHDTGRNKADPYEGIEAMVGLLENGKWLFPVGDSYSKDVTRLIEEEFVGLGTRAHDDILMTIWIWECLLRRYKKARRKRERATNARANPTRATIVRS